MKIRTKHGWPVETIDGRTFTNILRYLIQGNVRQSIKHMHKEKYGMVVQRAYEKGTINSYQMHELLGGFDRI